MTPLPPTPPPPPAAQPSMLPIVALVLGLVGLCLPFLACVAIPLGIVGIVSAVKNPAYGRLGFSIAAVVVPLLAIPIYAAIAIPNFIRFQARSKQAECKMNLKAAFNAEKAQFAEQNQYDPHSGKVGFAPERGNRYLYRFAPDGRLGKPGEAGDDVVGVAPDTQRYPEASPEALERAVAKYAGPLGVQGTCPDCSITIACAGNVDGDDAVDVWSISTASRVDSGGKPIPPGQPHHDYDDVTDAPNVDF